MSFYFNFIHRWKLCQCDRQFALELRNHEEEYNQEFSEVSFSDNLLSDARGFGYNSDNIRYKFPNKTFGQNY